MAAARVFRFRLFRQALRVRRSADRARPRLRGFAIGRRAEQEPRHADRAGPRLNFPQPLGDREPASPRRDARREASRRLACPAREDRHALAEHEPAGSGDVPHPPRASPSHRRQMVHLSHLRLGARPFRLHRERDALALHAGVRGPPAAVRLVQRARCRSRLLRAAALQASPT